MMYSVPIEIVNVANEERNEALGIQIEEEEKYADFYFKLSSLDGFWIDHEDSTIAFYVSGNSFRTPHSFRVEQVFTDALKKNYYI